MSPARAKAAGDPEPERGAAPREYLEVAAYYHWKERGCPWGDPLSDWLAAEMEWRSGVRHSRNKWRWFRPGAIPFLSKIFTQ